MKKITRVHIVTLLIAFLFTDYTSQPCQGAPLSLTSIMAYEEYAVISHPIPYTFELSKNSQHLFYFGANHSCDPFNMQYPLLEEFWNKFIATAKDKECAVLVEGYLRGGPFLCKEDAIINGGGEGGFITFLADQHTINVECADITQKELYYKLIDHFPSNYLYYKNFAQAALEFNRCKKNAPRLDFTQFYLNRGAPAQHLEEMLKVHQKLFNTPFNPHDEMFFYHITNPVETETVINQICRKASMLRDMHIIEYIERLIDQGKHVFVVYGCTHAVMQEKALRTIMADGNQ